MVAPLPRPELLEIPPPTEIHFVHYADLRADREGEMRRIARFLDIDVPESARPALVERASFEAIKQEAIEDEVPSGPTAFKNGVRDFFFKGNQRPLARCDHACRTR